MSVAQCVVAVKINRKGIIDSLSHAQKLNFTKPLLTFKYLNINVVLIF